LAISSLSAQVQDHHYQDLIGLFEQTFFNDFNTRLVKGGDEPIYLPAGTECEYHRIIFARGFYASALHEIAHWCIASAERQLKEDWGYWYLPDGRTAKQQKRFEQVEIKPQALEWAFCVASGFKFNVSADNLSGDCEADHQGFKRQVYQQVLVYLQTGFPLRAARFIKVLQDFYKTGTELKADDFSLF
jgi:elongation factor P hydroxylase